MIRAEPYLRVITADRDSCAAWHTGQRRISYPGGGTTYPSLRSRARTAASSPARNTSSRSPARWQTGPSWRSPTVLAALWAVLRHPRSWSGAVACAIGLGGDVDTLGAIVGALAGARLGLPAIPAHLADGVVDSARLKRLAVRYHALASRREAPWPEGRD